MKYDVWKTKIEYVTMWHMRHMIYDIYIAYINYIYIYIIYDIIYKYDMI